MTCRCDGSGWLPEMCLGRWRCPCADGYVKNARNTEALKHLDELCAECEAMKPCEVTSTHAGKVITCELTRCHDGLHQTQINRVTMWWRET